MKKINFSTLRRRPVNSSSSSYKIKPKIPSKVDILPSRKVSNILDHEKLIIGRQLEMMNVFLGFEQANKYAINTIDPSNSPMQPQTIGYIAEEDSSILATIKRQVLGTHRPFKATVMDANGNLILTVHRPFQFINSRVSVFDSAGNLLGQSQQQWHPIRRQYNLFSSTTSDDTGDDTAEVLSQFGAIDAPFLSWDFSILDGNQTEISIISKNLVGLAREIFTDTSVYSIDYFSSSDLTYNERATLLGCAISIDFDYFSRHSGSGGFLKWLPLFIFFE